MKGKTQFTEEEIKTLKYLISEKVISSPLQQKRIRDKIRQIGFFYSDFSNSKHGYTCQDLDELIKSGQVVCH
jgi:hypothetical protein